MFITELPAWSLWSIISSLTVAIFWLTIKLSGLAHRLKLANDELTRFGDQVALIKQKNDKSVSRISEISASKTEQLINTYEHEIKSLRREIFNLQPPKTLSDFFIKE